MANAGFYFGGPLVANSLADALDVLTLHGAVPLQLAHRFGGRFARRVQRAGGAIYVRERDGAEPERLHLL
ncbi:hypothetical protein Ade02nite_87640 [Paractinoplanes deccanensis]|uniref:Uncharacterized protein n=1 Tax=Paractinoplanes deccanensis TaxID=113561 RepID=A0ABQ3YJD8_9ACTN|nr:hypothetical protein Ade02nite_87640 [Actinoplanes deccanensis]